MGCPRIEAGPIPPRAGDVTMNSTALADVGCLATSRSTPGRTIPPSSRPHRDWHHDRNGEPGSRELLARVLYRNPRRQSAAIASTIAI